MKVLCFAVCAAALLGLASAVSFPDQNASDGFESSAPLASFEVNYAPLSLSVNPLTMGNGQPSTASLQVVSVPEPASIVAFGGAMLAVGFSRKRNERR